ncbi:hypothetical protein [Nonomuraea jabiensis]|uniref:Winged helix DNA-binding domain-containing protein n=1 Tax=Nonomuraea jabiensis TaxID=882448 RepID=A0A7W9G8W8_9ACTN|nr:hypothetical protein [Nonomuraea jabiensis]MBB5779319.1 hypothetical protein [Nonomuraea jabiensis]
MGPELRAVCVREVVRRGERGGNRGGRVTDHEYAKLLAFRVALRRFLRWSGKDRRVVQLTLTEAGERKLALLSATHLEELQRLVPLVTAFAEPMTATTQAP